MTTRILVAEDDDAIARSLTIYLKGEGYEILHARDGLEAVKMAKEVHVDLILMDLMMPRLSGEEAIERIRQVSLAPIIILSAKSEDVDKINGLAIGADDYMTKPFNPMELVARVKANLRRQQVYGTESRDEVAMGALVLDKKEKLITLDGEAVPLTPTEFEILSFFMTHTNQVFSLAEIYEAVWKEPAVDPKTVTVHIRRIREKIEVDPAHPIYLQVAWGLGYKFVDPSRKAR